MIAALALVWRFAGRVFGSTAGLAAVAVFATAPVAVIDGRVAWAPAALPVVAMLLVVLLSVVLVPTLRWRRWRYEIREEEVDLQRGIVWVSRTLVPLARIQHVDTTRSPLQRRYGLASVVLYTAAGRNEIPALADAVAESVRTRIAALANTRDDV